MQKRCEQLERINGELKSKLDELTALYDVAQRDNRNKATEIIRLNHELDKTREQKDQLTRENKKLAGRLFNRLHIVLKEVTTFFLLSQMKIMILRANCRI
jgi:hypothetical protein